MRPIPIVSAVLLSATLVIAQSTYEVSIFKRRGSANPFPHAESRGTGDIGVRHYFRNPCYPNSLVARASAHKLYTVAGAWVCNTVGNSSGSTARAVHRDVVFHAPNGPATIPVTLNYEFWGGITPNTSYAHHDVTVRMGPPSTQVSTWPRWTNRSINPSLTTSPQGGTTGTFTVPTNTPVGLWIESFAYTTANQYMSLSFALSVSGPVFNVPQGVSVTSFGANIASNAWGGPPADPNVTLDASPLEGVRGSVTTLTLRQGQPGSPVAFLIAPLLLGDALCATPRVCLLIAPPTVLGQGVTDGNGEATTSFSIPATVPVPMFAWLQAVAVDGSDIANWRTTNATRYDVR